MKIISNTMINLFYSALWSIAFVMFVYFLLIDLLPEDSAFFILLGWFLVSLILGIVHLIVFLPSLLLSSSKVAEEEINKTYQRLYPLLLLPLLAYLYITYLINSNSNFSEAGIQGALVIGIGLMIVHSISLYSLISRLHNSNKLSNEKNNQLSI